MMTDASELLSQASYQIELPLTIILDNQTTFEATQLLRSVPSKRLVFAGKWQNQATVAKLFMQSHRAMKHYQREVNGLHALQKAHIKTPAIYHAGWNDTHDMYVIIYEYLENAIPFSKVWESASALQQKHLLTQLMQITAQLHTQGLYQRDCHLDNFMYQHESALANCDNILDFSHFSNQDVSTQLEHQIHKTSRLENSQKISTLFENDNAPGIIMLDGATVVNQPHALNMDVSINNLAQLLAQFTSKNDHFFRAAFDEYNKLRGWQIKAPSFTQLEVKIQKWRNQRVKIYLNKALRTCTAFICEKSWDQFKVWDRDYDSREMHQLLDKPGSLFYQHGEEIFQESNYDVLATSFNQYNFLIRRYPIKGFWQQLKYLFYPSPARTAWLEMLKNRFLGLSSDQPIALIEQRQGLKQKIGYLIIDNK